MSRSFLLPTDDYSNYLSIPIKGNFIIDENTPDNMGLILDVDYIDDMFSIFWFNLDRGYSIERDIPFSLSSTTFKPRPSVGFKRGCSPTKQRLKDSLFKYLFTSGKKDLLTEAISLYFFNAHPKEVNWVDTEYPQLLYSKATLAHKDYNLVLEIFMDKVTSSRSSKVTLQEDGVIVSNLMARKITYDFFVS